MLKTFAALLFFLVSFIHCEAQMYRFKQSANVSVGGFVSDIGGGGRIGYSYLTGNGLFVSPQLFGEWGRPHQAGFSSFGADFGIGYSPFWFSNLFVFNLRASATGMYDALWGLNERHTGFSYGGRGGVELEYFVIPEFMTLTGYGNQIYLLKNTFGHSRFELGMMLKFNIGR